jgi:muramoyltetrapeptide carboxypeptidase
MSSEPDIAFVGTSGPWSLELVQNNLAAEHQPCHVGEPPGCEFPFHAGNAADRLAAFVDAQKNHKILWAIKGGYGASDLLPELAKTSLEPGRVLVGCSDVTALFPLLSEKGWSCLHANMPGFQKYAANAASSNALHNLLGQEPSSWQGEHSVKPINTQTSGPSIEGKLVCGNLAVLSNLIGTPYLKPFTEPTILVIEDIGENPGRVIRAWMQWQQSGMLKNAVAVVLGRFTGMGDENAKLESIIQQELAQRGGKIPIYCTEEVGHIEENFPLLYGSRATLGSDKLNWRF